MTRPFRTCCKRPQPDLTRLSLRQRPGKEPFVELPCLRCGGRVRSEVLHAAAKNIRTRCGQAATGCALARRDDEVTCLRCAMLLFAQRQGEARPDWRPAQPLAEDFYAL